MNEWEIATAFLIAALVPCEWVCMRRSFAEGVVAVQLAGTIGALALLALSEGQGREPFGDLAVVAAPLSFAGVLVFLRFLERMR
jgi:multisubunit Na+/H+ antiporter MnhF subunit